jgi:hypothetical protein
MAISAGTTPRQKYAEVLIDIICSQNIVWHVDCQRDRVLNHLTETA